MVKLLYHEQTGDVLSAIGREKQIKAGSRCKRSGAVPNWLRGEDGLGGAILAVEVAGDCFAALAVTGRGRSQGQGGGGSQGQDPYGTHLKVR